MTKPFDSNVLSCLIEKIGLVHLEGRPHAAPELAKEYGVGGGGDGVEESAVAAAGGH